MAISFDKALGIHQYTLGIRAQRAEVLASNIANADTPHYKARDVDFSSALQAAKGRQQGMSMAATSEKHFDLKALTAQHVQYRVPDQPDTGDGNTVDMQKSSRPLCKMRLNIRCRLGSSTVSSPG